MIGCLPTQALAFFAVFVYATHATQAIAFEWKPGLRPHRALTPYSPRDEADDAIQFPRRVRQTRRSCICISCVQQQMTGIAGFTLQLISRSTRTVRLLRCRFTSSRKAHFDVNVVGMCTRHWTRVWKMKLPKLDAREKCQRRQMISVDRRNGACRCNGPAVVHGGVSKPSDFRVGRATGSRKPDGQYFSISQKRYETGPFSYYGTLTGNHRRSI